MHWLFKVTSSTAEVIWHRIPTIIPVRLEEDVNNV